MNKAEIEEIKNIFDSIICLAVEGPDATSIRVVINKIIKEAGRGYNLCDRHLTSAMRSDGEGHGQFNVKLSASKIQHLKSTKKFY